MSRTTASQSRKSRATTAKLAGDPMGALLVRQRPEVVPGVVPTPMKAILSAERIEDAQAVSALLASCSNLTDAAEEDLIFELLYLETLLACRPMKSKELLRQLGELGEDVREGLLPPGVINIVRLRRRTRLLRQHLGVAASRMTAALLVFFTTAPFFNQQEARAAEQDPNSFQLASAPVVRVVDANTGRGIAGVKIKSMEEHLLGVTDTNGQATLAEGYNDTDLLSLEKDGYQMYLLDRSQISSRNVVSMKPSAAKFASEAHAPKSPKVPHAPKAPTPPKIVHHPDGSVALVPPKMPSTSKSPLIKLPTRATAKKPEHGVALNSAGKRPAWVPHNAQPTLLAEAHHGAETKATHPTNKPAAHPKGAAHPPAHAAAIAGTAAVVGAAAEHHQSLHNAPSYVPELHAAKPPSHAMNKPAMALKPKTPGQVADKDPMGTAEHSVPVPKKVPMHSAEAAAHQAGDHAAQAGHAYYQVKAGDTLSALAYRYLGNANRWPEIYRANHGRMSSPHTLHIGQMLLLPRGGAYAKMAHGHSYVVHAGDSLFTIAAAELGDGNQWHKIFQLNRGRIRNPRVIYPGQHIHLPG